MAGRFSNPNVQYLDENGDPLAGGKLAFFESNTTTPLDTFSDDNLSVKNTNPIILDDAGRSGDIFFLNQDYKVELSDADDAVIWTADPVRSTEQKSSEVRQVSTTTQLDSSDDGKWIAANANAGGFVITLPPASEAGNGYEVTIQKTDSSTNVVTVDASGSETINGQSDVSLERQYQAITVRCDGTNWLSPLEEGRALPPEHINGLTLSNGGTPATDVDVAAGSARSDNDAVNIELTNGTTKKLNAAFAEGQNQGGLDSGTVAADTTYHIFLIGKSDGTSDVLFSTSATSPALPSGFTDKRRIGQTRTDSGSSIISNWFSSVEIWGEIFVSEIEVSGNPTNIDLARNLLSGFTEIDVTYDEIQLSGGDESIFQMYASDTAVTTGYGGSIGNIGGQSAIFTTDGWRLERDQAATNLVTGLSLFRKGLSSNNLWNYSANSARTNENVSTSAAGRCVLTNEFDGLRLTTINGTDTYNSSCVIRTVAKKFK